MLARWPNECDTLDCREWRPDETRCGPACESSDGDEKPEDSSAGVGGADDFALETLSERSRAMPMLASSMLLRRDMSWRILRTTRSMRPPSQSCSSS